MLPIHATSAALHVRPIDTYSDELPERLIDAESAAPPPMRPIDPPASIEKVENERSLKKVYSNIKMKMIK